ncbi:fructose-6-phosphate aldolase [Candidatus Peregrinibacteria bacterium]|nr:fructose-6-phosphate aldolase [Candidatus Peregrinibacteria bacterium]
MQLFLDTANLSDIKKYAALGIVDGITTNPTLIAKEGASLEKRIKEIAEVVDGPISAEVTATNLKEMINEGRKIAKWHPNVYVKVPSTSEGLQAVKIFKSENIRTNTTLVFSASQALLAAKVGADFVSPFIGRLDDISEPGMDLIADIVKIFKNYNFATKVLVASIRHPRHIVEAALIGADIATMPAEVMEKLIHHPLTDLGLEKFLKDWRAQAKKLRA